MKKLTIEKTSCIYCSGIIPNKRKRELRIQAHTACKSTVEDIEKEHGLKQIKKWLNIGTPDGNRAHSYYKPYMPDSISMLKDSLTALIFGSVKLTRRIPDSISELTNLKELGLLGLEVLYDYEDDPCVFPDNTSWELI